MLRIPDVVIASREETMQESQELQQHAGKKSIPVIVGIVCAALMVAALFLPYATATSDGAAYLENHSSQSVMQGFDLTTDQMKNMSLVDFARAYLALAEHSYQQLSGIYMGLVVAMGAAALLMALCFAKRRPIGALVSDVLAFGIFSLQNADYASRGVVPSANYDWGIAYYLVFVVLAVAALAAVWLFVEKKRAKKAR